MPTATPLSTRITMPPADANIRYVRVTLPRTLNARLTVIGDACTRAEFEGDVAKCAHAQAGTATADRRDCACWRVWCWCRV